MIRKDVVQTGPFHPPPRRGALLDPRILTSGTCVTFIIPRLTSMEVISMKRRRALAAGIAVLALSLAGCGGGLSPSEYNRQAISRAAGQQASVEAVRAALVSRLHGWTDEYGNVHFLMPGENAGIRM